MTPLRQRMIEDMKVRNLAPLTQETYLRQVSQFARHFGRSPEALGPEEIRAYQVYLATEKQLSPTSIGIAVAALRFLYNETLHKHWDLQEVIPMPRIPTQLPVVLSPEEVLRFLESVPHIRPRTILTTCYATGLRISEAGHLKPCDIDSQRMVIRVEQGKGQKIATSCSRCGCWETLRHWWSTARPRIWLFPGQSGDKPITRHAVEKACHEAHPRSGIPKPVTPHSFRHAFAVPHARKRNRCTHDPSCCWGIAAYPRRQTT